MGRSIRAVAGSSRCRHGPIAGAPFLLQPGLRFSRKVAYWGPGARGWRGHDRPDGTRRRPGRRGHRPPAAHPALHHAGWLAVLLFAMASGHLKGMQATIGVVAALVQVSLAVGALTRPSRELFGARPPSTRRSPCSGWPSRAPHGFRGDGRHRGGALGDRRAGGCRAGDPARTGQQVALVGVGVRIAAPCRYRRLDHRGALRQRRCAEHAERRRAGRGPGRGCRQAGPLIDR